MRICLVDLLHPIEYGRGRIVLGVHAALFGLAGGGASDNCICQHALDDPLFFPHLAEHIVATPHDVMGIGMRIGVWGKAAAVGDACLGGGLAGPPTACQRHHLARHRILFDMVGANGAMRLLGARWHCCLFCPGFTRKLQALLNLA